MRPVKGSFRGVACSPEAKPAPSGANGNTVDRYRLKPLQEAIVRPIRESEAESKRKSRAKRRSNIKIVDLVAVLCTLLINDGAYRCDAVFLQQERARCS
jgi:hypothetical protein